MCVCDDHTPRYSWIKFDKCSYGNRVCVSSYKCFQTLHSSYYMIGYVFSQWIHMLVDRVILCVWKKKLNFIVLINQRWFLCVSSLRFTHTVDQSDRGVCVNRTKLNYASQLFSQWSSTVLHGLCVQSPQFVLSVVYRQKIVFQIMI